ncbi:hypothetical protein [Herminiimonas contaminans]|uniref:N-acetyltransferase domain-containing protein n=1 Tax=Herminiimonas contaminans TaxID=1111140 RepID=A0ABS0EQY4_9BURK|nr:hypothetical protein [Herminiimonas contaminans]MBF8177247.1 hypothetical protein [Herminiimonas contaminans]
MFDTLSLEASLHICKNMRATDLACLQAVMGDISVESFAIDRYQTHGAAWAFYQDGVPVVMAGITSSVPWLGVAWMVSTDAVSADSWKKIIRFSRNVFRNASRKYQRIDAYVLETWPQAKRYAEKVGFKQVNVRERVGREGQNVLDFAIIGAIE